MVRTCRRGFNQWNTGLYTYFQTRYRNTSTDAAFVMKQTRSQAHTRRCFEQTEKTVDTLESERG